MLPIKSKNLTLALISTIILSCKSSKVLENSKPGDLNSNNSTYFNKSTAELPGEKELSTIQKYYPETSLDELRIGYTLYYQGACADCHKPKKIQEFKKEEWKGILDEMAIKAKINEQSKLAIYKYVMSVSNL